MSYNTLQKEIFYDLYHTQNIEYFSTLQLFFEKHGEQIVDHFYTKLSSLEESQDFLTSEVVEKHLKHTLLDWLLSISNFTANNDYSIYLEKQRQIGNTHARVQVPVCLVNYAVDILKQYIFRLLIKEEVKETAILVNLINRIIDLAVMLFNNIFFDNFIQQKKDEQNLRQHYISHNLALEFEQSRADLLHWQRELMTLLFYPYSKVSTKNITPLSRSKFGLWIDHRAALLFYNQSEVKKIKANLYQIDKQLVEVIHLNKTEKWEQLAEQVTEMDQLIITTDWLLDQVAKDIAELENNKDPLTKMFTRRYLPNIIQHEIHYCLERNVSLGLIMVDLDYFKNINDLYGHTVGDSVLSITAAILSNSIRAYDYVFRYGGEEFLILINNTNSKNCQAIAEEIRTKVENHSFKDLPFIKDPITISLGVAMFDKHPDYEQLINQADQALYMAKKNGRNRVELYKAI
ncbi:MAG: GGDEF domain-containing protein [Methylococcales bacterium]